MAGHNKWSKVKHKKGAADAAKSKVWTKIIREITVAAKMGGDDQSANPRLRKALDDARAANITKDTIQRALSRSTGQGDGADFEDLVYEGYGPGGVAVLVECLTDNRNRTSGEVRSAFGKNGGNLGSTGSVAFGFKKKGRFYFDKSAKGKGELSEDRLLAIGLEAGIEDIFEEKDVFIVSCEPESFMNLKDAFTSSGLVLVSSEIEMVPDVYVPLSGDQAKAFLKLVDVLEELDDVQNVWSNEDISDEELQKWMA
jgi:YebC/PmpR family DNA-binding regulatory protein